MRLECDAERVWVVLGPAQLEALAQPHERKAELIRVGLDALERAEPALAKEKSSVPAAPAASEPAQDDGDVFYEAPTDAPPPTPPPSENGGRISSWAIEGAVTYENFGGDTSGFLGGELRLAPAISKRWAVRSAVGIAGGMDIPDDFRVMQWNVGVGLEVQPFEWLSVGVSALLSSFIFTRDPTLAQTGTTSQQLGGELDLAWSPFGYGSGPRLGLRARLYEAERAIFIGSTESFRLAAGTFGFWVAQRFGFD